MLSAALYRVLRATSIVPATVDVSHRQRKGYSARDSTAQLDKVIDEIANFGSGDPTSPDVVVLRPRQVARKALQTRLQGWLISALGGGEPVPGEAASERSGGKGQPGRDNAAGKIAEGQRANVALEHVARIVHALASPTSLVVVTVDADPLPTEFSVTLPSESLAPAYRLRVPSLAARVSVGLLIPSGESNRNVAMSTPDGVSFCGQRRTSLVGRRASPRGNGSAAVRPVIEVDDPPSRRRLADLLAELLGPDPARAFVKLRLLPTKRRAPG